MLLPSIIIALRGVVSAQRVGGNQDFLLVSVKITNLSRDAIFGHHQSLFIYQRGGENTQTTRQIGPIRLIPPKLKDTNLCTIKPSTFATIRNNFDFLICLSHNFDVSTFGLRIAYDCCKFQGLSVSMKSKRWIKKKEKSQVFASYIWWNLKLL